MLKHFTEETGQGDWPVVCWLSLIPFLKLGDILASFQMAGSFLVSRDF